MATLYVRSTDGNDADNGSTWALANATAAGAMTDAAAGDRIWFSQVHTETQASALTITAPGTLASQNELLCGNDAAEPPTALATGAAIATTGANAITVNGNCYVYGLSFSSGSSTSQAAISLSGTSTNHQHYKSCGFTLNNSNVASRIIAGASSGGSIGLTVLEGCTFTFGATTQGFNARNGRLIVRGGAIAGSAIVTLFATAPSTIVDALFEGVDLSNGASTMNIVAAAPSGYGLIRLHGCKLPASWTGNIYASAPTGAALDVQLIDCDSGDTNYRLWLENYAGSVKHFTGMGAIDVTGSGRYNGATEITRFSWLLTCSANVRYPNIARATREMFAWNSAVGSSKTATVEVIHNSQGSGASGVLNEGDLFLRVTSKNTAGFTLVSDTDDGPADILDTGANADAQDTSTTAWSGPAARANTTAYLLGDLITVSTNVGRVFICSSAGTSAGSEPAGYATAADGDSITDSGATFKAMRRNTLSVVFTPQEIGYVAGVVMGCKASGVFYIDPNSFAVA